MSPSEQQAGSKKLLSGNAIAGVVGGFTSSLIMHPLDVVTTRMQAQDGRFSRLPKYRNPLLALVTIAKTEGFKNLYAGLIPNLVGSTTNWGVYFYGYNYTRNALRTYLQNSESDHADSKDLGPVMNLVCATITGCISAIITQPIWLSKTRMELQEATHVKYRGMIHCISSVIRNEGIRALFRYTSPHPADLQLGEPAPTSSMHRARQGASVSPSSRVGRRGLAPSLLLVSHIALHFMAYEVRWPPSGGGDVACVLSEVRVRVRVRARFSERVCASFGVKFSL
jgi:hypothetical protein